MGEVVFQCSFFFVFKCLDETVKKKKKKVQIVHVPTRLFEKRRKDG